MTEPMRQICDDIKEVDIRIGAIEAQLASLRARRRGLIAELESRLEKELPGDVIVDLHLMQEG